MKKAIGKVNPVDYVKEHGYPEVGTFSSEKDLQKFYKKLDTSVLEDWAGLEGLTFTPCPTSEPIHRMRVAMAILYKHFPKQTAPKVESKYKQYSLEDLIQLASDKDVPVEMCDDERILRMRLIMNLRAHKVIG